MSDQTDKLQQSFGACDKIEDDNIRYAEFANLMSNLGAHMSAAECRIGFAEIDTNKDGVISPKEFVAWFAGNL